MAEILLGNIKGENGATYTPALDSDGNLSWANDKGLPNPPTVNIKGPQGPAGSGGGSGDGIPRTGNRGVLAGSNALNLLVNQAETVINGSTNDDTFLMCQGMLCNVTFEKGGSETWCKHIAVYNEAGLVTLTVPSDGSILFDNATAEYAPSALDLLVYVWYGDVGLGIIYTKQIA